MTTRHYRINREKVASFIRLFKGLTPARAIKILLGIVFVIVFFNIAIDDRISSVDQTLVEAVEIGDLQGAASAITRGASVNRTDLHGSTPLHTTAWRGDLAMAKLLIAAGADINAADNRSGETPLHSAARGIEPAMMAFLLKYGADPDARTHADSEQCNGTIFPAGVTAQDILQLSGVPEQWRHIAGQQLQ